MCMNLMVACLFEIRQNHAEQEPNKAQLTHPTIEATARPRWHRHNSSSSQQQPTARFTHTHPPDSTTDCAPTLDWPAMPATWGKCAPHCRQSSRSFHHSPTRMPCVDSKQEGRASTAVKHTRNSLTHPGAQIVATQHADESRQAEVPAAGPQRAQRTWPRGSASAGMGPKWSLGMLTMMRPAWEQRETRARSRLAAGTAAPQPEAAAAQAAGQQPASTGSACAGLHLRRRWRGPPAVRAQW